VNGEARAGLVSRGGAFLTDLVLLMAGVAGAAELARLAHDVMPRFVHDRPIHAVLVAATPVFFAAYHVLFWSVVGWTPGQWLFGLAVVNMRGGRLHPLQALVRVLAYTLSALPLYLGFLWALTPARRAWHDILAGTAVIYDRKGAIDHGV
jgi:uncharacterized RDD family membrane protein YckC